MAGETSCLATAGGRSVRETNAGGWVKLQKTKRILSALALTGVAAAALSAPLYAFAETEQSDPNPSVSVMSNGVPAAPEQPVRVGIGRSQTAVEVTAPQGLYVVAEGAVHWDVPAGQSVQLKLSSGAIEVVGLAQRFTGPVRLVPKAPGGTENPITYQRKPYRGEIEVVLSRKDGKLSVVNVVNLEDYVKGVVPLEMPPKWPEEALKAQAVAARTYVLASLGAYGDEGFDVVDTTNSQVYGGIRAETDSTNRAVDATRGEVVTYKGKVATTYFHSSSGGHTENNETIFSGKPVAYLRGVPDYDNLPDNPRYSWTFNFTPEEFASKLKAANFAVGEVERISPAGETGASGRPSQWRITGSDRTVTLTAMQLRSALGVPGIVKTVDFTRGGVGSLTESYEEGDQFYVLGASGVERITLDEVVVLGAGGDVEEMDEISALGPEGVLEGGIVVEGGGYGHGVGLSQWGAKGMAQQGYTYEEILAHFYQGTNTASVDALAFRFNSGS